MDVKKSQRVPLFTFFGTVQNSKFLSDIIVMPEWHEERIACLELQVINPNNFQPLLFYLNIRANTTGIAGRRCNISIMMPTDSVQLNVHASMIGTTSHQHNSFCIH